MSATAAHPRRLTPEQRLRRILGPGAVPAPSTPPVELGPPTLAELDEQELWFLSQVPASAGSLSRLLAIDPASLSTDGLAQIHYLQACDRLTRLAAALTSTALMAITGTEPLRSATFRDQQAVEKEIAVARGTGPVATATAVPVARDLATVFTRSHEALSRGVISDGHVRVLCERTGLVSDPGTRRRIEAEVLPQATRQTAYAFGKTVDAAVCTHDSAGARSRHEQAKHSRRVVTYRGQDGMGAMAVHDTWSRIQAMKTSIDTDARELQLARGGATAARTDPDAYLDTCRADALAAIILGTDQDAPPDHAAPPGHTTPPGHTAAPDDMSPTPGARSPREPREPGLTGELVIDLRTLQGLNENFALLDGSPIPAAIGRDLARTIRSWRRIVTDPLTGHLLDYGRSRYLPEPLLRHVGARDGICRAPFCNAPGSRSQVDHARPWAQGGTSDPTNMGLLCSHDDHALKTDKDFWHITDNHPDGSATFTTNRGQAFRIPARPYLHDPTSDQPHAGPRASGHPPVPRQ